MTGVPPGAGMTGVPPGAGMTGVPPSDLGGPPLPLPAAGYGPTPAASQVATTVGPSFTGAAGSFPIAATSFPVLAASLVANGKISSENLDVVTGGLTGTSWVPEPSPTSVIATVVSVAADGTMQIQLSVPSLNLVTPLLAYHPISASFNLDYTFFGEWTFSNQPNSDPIRFVKGVFGYETPAAAMPVSGTAAYTSAAGSSVGGYLVGEIFAANGDAIASLYGGNASLSVNFATGQISGALTNFIAHQEYGGDGYNPPWYDISIAASISGGTNKFSGATTRGSTSVPLSGTGAIGPVSTALSASAQGSINGAFYGPAAQNLGAVWTIGDSNVFAIGSFGAARH